MSLLVPLAFVRMFLIAVLMVPLGSAVFAAQSILAAPRAVSSSTSSSHTITIDGVAREYLLYVPENLPESAPLVVMVHGGFGNASQAETSYGWDAKAEKEGFIVAYPDGLGRAWSVGGGCCGSSGNTNVDDVGFITAMVAEIEAEQDIDLNRIYATGMSNGGLMAYRLACDTDIFAAIGPNAATMLGDCPDPAPISVIHIHGTADESVHYDGSVGSGVARIDGPAIPQLNEFWRTVDGCEPPEETNDGTITISTAGCPGGRTVELITIEGAGHQWPGNDTRRNSQKILGADEPSSALDATEVIWKFFTTHPKSTS